MEATGRVRRCIITTRVKNESSFCFLHNRFCLVDSVTFLCYISKKQNKPPPSQEIFSALFGSEHPSSSLSRALVICGSYCCSCWLYKFSFIKSKLIFVATTISAMLITFPCTRGLFFTPNIRQSIHYTTKVLKCICIGYRIYQNPPAL